VAGEGLVSMKPSSIAFSGTSASINSDGGVDFSAVSSLSLNDVFTSDYDNYLLVMRHVGSSAGQDAVTMRLRAAGSDATAADYTGQSLFSSSTTVAAGRGTSLTGFFITNTDNTQRNGVQVHVYGPALAQPTATRSVTVESTSEAILNDYANTHSLSTSYDGFTLLVASPDTMTGNIHVFGYEE
jgi:hypothetical protein